MTINEVYPSKYNREIRNRIDELNHQKDQLDEEHRRRIEEIDNTINFLKEKLIK